MKNVYITSAVCAVLVLFFSKNAYAYLDPGTGSMLLQGLIAAVAAGLIIIRTYWDRWKSLLSARKKLGRSLMHRLLQRKHS